MNTEEILSLPTLDRLKYINSVNDTFGFLKKLKSEKSELPSEIPIWFLRQAGRHIPEYFSIRSKSKNFIDFCNCFFFVIIFIT